MLLLVSSAHVMECFIVNAASAKGLAVAFADAAEHLSDRFPIRDAFTCFFGTAFHSRDSYRRPRGKENR